MISCQVIDFKSVSLIRRRVIKTIIEIIRIGLRIIHMDDSDIPDDADKA